MGTRKKLNALRNNKQYEALQIAMVVAEVQPSVDKIEEQFAEIMTEVDPVKKISMLEQLESGSCLRVERDYFAGVTSLASFFREFTLKDQIVECFSIRYTKLDAIDKKTKQLTNEDKNLSKLLKEIVDQHSRINGALREIQSTCSLKDVAESPCLADVSAFNKFLNKHETLKDRFDAAVYKAVVSGANSPPAPNAGNPGMQP